MSDDNIAALALDSIRRPVSYDALGQRVQDREGECVLDVRGWGRLGHLAEGAAKQDAIGEWLVDMINAAKAPEPKPYGYAMVFMGSEIGGFVQDPAAYPEEKEWGLFTFIPVSEAEFKTAGSLDFSDESEDVIKVEEWHAKLMPRQHFALESTTLLVPVTKGQG